MDDARASGGSTAWALVRLARPQQWSKSAFVAVGPVYGVAQGAGEGRPLGEIVWAVFAACASFALVSSGLYVVNDLMDAEADRAHPRKRRRPIASGRISPRLALGYAAVLLAVGLGAALAVPAPGRWWVLGLVGAHALNVLAYSACLKHHAIADVVSLSMGFVLRVLGGCAALMIEPSTWLLNATFFLSMFLAFGKRLGERRSLGGEEATAARAVQQRYSTDLLRMSVVVTAVATLLTYAQYVLTRDDQYWAHAPGGGFGMNLLWLTLLPATYAMLRALLLLERGVYDDPTELATRDRPFQLAALVFAGWTACLILLRPGGA